MLPSVPKDLGERADYVANAFADEQLGRLKGVAFPETRDDLAKWYEKVRPTFDFKPPQAPGNMVTISINIASTEIRGEGEGTAHTFATLIPPLRPGATGMPQQVTLDLYWALKDEDWLLDGSTILKEATRGGEPAKKK